jgi:hypothetical protein
MESRETFKDIKGYEGVYQISNFGRVKSLRREFVNSRGQHRILEESFLKESPHKGGYVKVGLTVDGKTKTFNVHRLVASAFCEKKIGNVEVNHIDGNKKNNHYSNLEWVTRSENTKHAFDNNLGNFKDRALNNLKKINNALKYHRVIFKKKNEVIVFDSVSKASDYIGTHRDNITRAIRKGHKCQGYEVFGVKYANEETLSSSEIDNLVESIPNAE